MTLLERWAKAEPERVEDDGQYMTLVAGDYLHTLPRDITLDDPALLGFIVSAIEARGWGLCIVTSESGYSTSVRVPYRGLFYGSGAQLSEALLTAHLAALDAVEGEG